MREPRTFPSGYQHLWISTAFVCLVVIVCNGRAPLARSDHALSSERREDPASFCILVGDHGMAWTHCEVSCAEDVDTNSSIAASEDDPGSG